MTMTKTHDLEVQRDEAIYRLLKQRNYEAQRARIELGILLVAARRNGIWKGRAENWGAFLAEESICWSDANHLMEIAQTFFYELDCGDAELSQLAKGSFPTMCLAAKVATIENCADVLAIVENLGERDATESLKELMQQKPRKEKKGTYPKLRQVA